MDRRLELHELLVEILGSRNVYFQPPPNVVMQYPAIVYSLDDIWSRHADNSGYMHRDRYSVTLIDRNPDNGTKHKLAHLGLCSFSRAFQADGLNHYAFDLYF